MPNPIKGKTGVGWNTVFLTNLYVLINPFIY